MRDLQIRFDIDDDMDDVLDEYDDCTSSVMESKALQG